MSPLCTAPPATPASQRWPNCTRSTRSTVTPSRASRPSWAPGWWSSARRRRSSPGSPTPCARPASCFGPSGEAARLEGSKAFAKDVMAGAGVPTARSYVCTTPAEIDEALDAFGAPYVVKDDGLASRQGRRRHRGRGRGPRPRALLRPRGHRGVPRRPRGQPLRHHRRHHGRAAPARPGLQARPGRRRGPEHRRHGRLLPAPVGRPQAGRRGPRNRPPADRRRAAPPGHPFSGCSTRASRSPRAASGSSSSTPASATRDPGRPGPAARPRWPASCSPPPTAPSTSSRR